MDGVLPPEIVYLTSLTSFDVSVNSIRGELVELPPSLTFLDVEGNQMNGSPFASILQMPELKQLHISSNAFTGEIPTDLGALESLEEIWLANNQFNGATIPSEIGNLENLGTKKLALFVWIGFFW